LLIPASQRGINPLIMSLSKKVAAAIFVSLFMANASFAQVCRNLFPYAEGVVYDNNGHDLKAFIESNKKDLLYKGGKINEFSNNTWGYLQISNAKAPSLDNDGNMNFSQYINATLALYKTKDGAEATWWSRQCNSSKGPLVNEKVDAGDRLDMPLVSSHDITHDLEFKSFTVVEYFSDVYDPYDYDVLLKNYLLVKTGTVKDVNDYQGIISFYDVFLKKFTYVEDPLLENKSFITFFTANGTRYLGYFNIANSKLAGHLLAVHLDYEKDKEELLNHIFSKLTGHVVYIYGDNLFSMDKNLLDYSRTHDVKLIQRNTATMKMFNDEK
jgi:hypothetical protein